MRDPSLGSTSRIAFFCAAALLPLSRPATAQTAPPIQLDEVVVTPNLTPTETRAVGSAVTVIDSTELDERQVRVVSDVLRTVPGVTVGRSGPTGGLTQLRLRGAEANQTLVLIDGIEVNDPASGSEFDFAHLLAQGVERIEVLRGPQSALYGSDAIGGVVNIVTKRGTGAPTVAGFAEGGSQGFASGAMSAGGAVGKFDYYASAGGLRTDGVSSAAAWNGNDEADGYRNLTAFGKLGFQPLDILRLDAVGRVTDYRAESDDFLGGVGPVDGDGGSEGLQLFGRVDGRLALFDGRWRQRVGIARSHFDNDYLAGDVVTSTSIGDRTKIDYQSDLGLTSAFLVPARHDLTLLVEHQRDAADTASSYSAFDRSVEQTSLAGQYRLGLWDDLFLTGSVRHDWNDRFADDTTFRLTAAYTFDATGTKLRASYGTGVKNPTLFELYGYTDTYRGNPDLTPESAQGWDVGVDQWVWRERLLLQATYFNQRISDLIQGTGQTSINVAGTSTIQGVELGLMATPLADLTLRGSYTYTPGEDATGRRLVRQPAHQASLDVDYRFWHDRASINLGVTYTGEQQDLFYNADYTTRRVTLDDFVLIDVAATYDIGPNAQVYGRVENLLDTRYEEVAGYGSKGIGIVAGLKLAF
ncbi:TonB-dependent siderophore receptor [Acuticoccus sp. I52.16.1]|uniref:TonB-dependent receptor plug domain-containing protein n=1 Tax=Acuticoccus sp. I52.16.1 TaxID=2928472 RepID=UPI001FD3B1B2|nr:TonB-dependent receptor [Acuticoccus sp. I52.16.1]UOM33005.1 TonB-dependent receptor [Acuticoccus sp. I52.16.1]